MKFFKNPPVLFIYLVLLGFTSTTQAYKNKITIENYSVIELPQPSITKTLFSWLHGFTTPYQSKTDPKNDCSWSHHIRGGFLALEKALEEKTASPLLLQDFYANQKNKINPRFTTEETITQNKLLGNTIHSKKDLDSVDPIQRAIDLYKESTRNHRQELQKLLDKKTLNFKEEHRVDFLLQQIMQRSFALGETLIIRMGEGFAEEVFTLDDENLKDKTKDKIRQFIIEICKPIAEADIDNQENFGLTLALNPMGPFLLLASLFNTIIPPTPLEVTIPKKIINTSRNLLKNSLFPSGFFMQKIMLPLKYFWVSTFGLINLEATYPGLGNLLDKINRWVGSAVLTIRLPILNKNNGVTVFNKEWLIQLARIKPGLIRRHILIKDKNELAQERYDACTKILACLNKKQQQTLFEKIHFQWFPSYEKLTPAKIAEKCIVKIKEKRIEEQSIYLSDIEDAVPLTIEEQKSLKSLLQRTELLPNIEFKNTAMQPSEILGIWKTVLPEIWRTKGWMEIITMFFNNVAFFFGGQDLTVSNQHSSSILRQVGQKSLQTTITNFNQILESVNTKIDRADNLFDKIQTHTAIGKLCKTEQVLYKNNDLIARQNALTQLTAPQIDNQQEKIDKILTTIAEIETAIIPGFTKRSYTRNRLSQALSTQIFENGSIIGALPKLLLESGKFAGKNAINITMKKIQKERKPETYRLAQLGVNTISKAANIPFAIKRSIDDFTEPAFEFLDTRAPEISEKINSSLFWGLRLAPLSIAFPIAYTAWKEGRKLWKTKPSLAAFSYGVATKLPRSILNLDAFDVVWSNTVVPFSLQNNSYTTKAIKTTPSAITYQVTEDLYKTYSPSDWFTKLGLFLRTTIAPKSITLQSTPTSNNYTYITRRPPSARTKSSSPKAPNLELNGLMTAVGASTAIGALFTTYIEILTGDFFKHPRVNIEFAAAATLGGSALALTGLIGVSNLPKLAFIIPALLTFGTAYGLTALGDFSRIAWYAGEGSGIWNKNQEKMIAEIYHDLQKTDELRIEAQKLCNEITKLFPVDQSSIEGSTQYQYLHDRVKKIKQLLNNKPLFNLGENIPKQSETITQEAKFKMVKLKTQIKQILPELMRYIGELDLVITTAHFLQKNNAYKIADFNATTNTQCSFSNACTTYRNKNNAVTTNVSIDQLEDFTALAPKEQKIILQNTSSAVAFGITKTSNDAIIAQEAAEQILATKINN